MRIQERAAGEGCLGFSSVYGAENAFVLKCLQVICLLLCVLANILLTLPVKSAKHYRLIEVCNSGILPSLLSALWRCLRHSPRATKERKSRCQKISSLPN